MSNITASVLLLISVSSLAIAGYPAPVQAQTSTSWNPRVECTPTIVRISDITANKTGSASFSASPFTPGTTTSVSGGNAKRWLTPGPTPPGWHSPGPACTVTNSKGTRSLFVQINGIMRGSITTEDGASSYDPTNGGTSHSTTYDSTFNVFDPAIVKSYSSSCTSASDPTCYGRIHVEIDHDWKAAGYCGASTVCDASALASKTTSSSTRIDIQGFVYWDAGNTGAAHHSFNGWEIHPMTGWRLSGSPPPGQPDFTLTASPTSVSFPAGSTGGFTTTVTGQNGFTGTVSLATSSSPSTGLTVSCSPSSITGGSGRSICSLSSSSVGSYAVTVRGTSGSLSHSTTVSVMVSAQPSSGTYTVSWQGYDWDGGSEETITLNGRVVSKLPSANSPQNAGVWASFTLGITSFIVKGSNTLTFTHAAWDCGVSDSVRNLQVASGTTIVYSNPTTYPLSCTQSLTYTFTV